MLIRNGLLFEKPYEITDHLVYPFVPDALISKQSIKLNRRYHEIFNTNKNNDIVFELFGIQGNEDYDRLKDEKNRLGRLINQENEYSYCKIDTNCIDDVKSFFVSD